jgi:D-methionine transport system ATP-binding protein
VAPGARTEAAHPGNGAVDPLAPAILMQGVALEVADAAAAVSPVRLLHEIDLHVPSGGLLHILGPSGAGKSSLIRLINRLDEATSGSVDVLGRRVQEWPVRELRRRVAIAFQESSLLGLTVRENLSLPFELGGSKPPDLDRRVGEALGLAGLGPEMLDRDATRLSVGQKQRVALARALIGEPEVLLLDEPTSGLDPRTAERLLDSIAGIREGRRLSIVMVTHRLEEARRLGGDLVVLIEGRVEAHGAVEAVVASPPNGRVRHFLSGDDDATG